jgi:membrane protein DedA with SNARE-associated domain
VILVAATAAILGDNLGYWIARTGGRALVRRWAFVARYADRALPPAERFFRKHGAKTVFFGRFVALLRVTAAWLAGLSRMPWWRFLLWNALGGVAWAVLVSLVAYEFGHAAAAAIARYGLVGVGGLVVLGAIALVGLKVWRSRALEGA